VPSRVRYEKERERERTNERDSCEETKDQELTEQSPNDWETKSEKKTLLLLFYFTTTNSG